MINKSTYIWVTQSDQEFRTRASANIRNSSITTETVSALQSQGSYNERRNLIGWEGLGRPDREPSGDQSNIFAAMRKECKTWAGRVFLSSLTHSLTHSVNRAQSARTISAGRSPSALALQSPIEIARLGSIDRRHYDTDRTS